MFNGLDRGRLYMYVHVAMNEADTAILYFQKNDQGASSLAIYVIWALKYHDRRHIHA